MSFVLNNNLRIFFSAFSLLVSCAGFSYMVQVDNNTGQPINVTVKYAICRDENAEVPGGDHSKSAMDNMLINRKIFNAKACCTTGYSVKAGNKTKDGNIVWYDTCKNQKISFSLDPEGNILSSVKSQPDI
jgi:hypothetical protein